MQYLSYTATDDAGEKRGFAYVIKGGNTFSDPNIREQAEYFSGHGSGRGPVYHSSTLGGSTQDLLVDSKTGRQYILSGSIKYIHKSGVYTYALGAIFHQGYWDVISVTRAPWGDSTLGRFIMGSYKGRILNCAIIRDKRSETDYRWPQVDQSISWDLANELVQDIDSLAIDSAILKVADMVNPKNTYLSFGSYCDNSFSVERKWKRPQCPFRGDYLMCCEIGELGLSNALRTGLSNATLAMVDNIPRSGINLIATSMDLLKILTGDIQAISSIADLWLSYRYVYTTNKLDIQSMKMYLKRLSSLSKSSTLTAYGKHVNDNGSFYCQAKLSMQNPDVVRVAEAAAEAHRQLSLVNAWDLIPWSFVIDWILPIEDLCRCIDNTSELATLHPIEVWYSYKTNRSRGDGVWERTYFRLPCMSSFVTTPLSLFDVDGGETSEKTKLFRFLDSVSLIFGR